MKQRIMIGLFLLALLLSSGGAVYYKRRAADAEERWAKAAEQLSRKIRPPDRPAAPRPIPVAATNHPAERLKELDALRLELEQKEQEIAELKSRTGRTHTVPSAEERQARMEELKQTDPEAYEKRMARREDMRTRMQTAFAERAAILLDREPPDLTDDELAERAVMLETLNDIWQLSENLSSGEGNRRETMQALMEKSQEVKPLLKNERERQLYDLGMASGYNEEEAAAFVDYVNETLEATSLPRPNRSRRRTPGGP